MAHYDSNDECMNPDGETLERERRRLEQVCAARPEDRESRLRLGQVCQVMGRFGDAARHYAESAALELDWDQPRYHLGTVLDQLGREEEAITAFRAALSVNARHAESHYCLGRIMARRRDVSAATRHFDAAILSRPGWPSSHLGKGDVLAAGGDIAAARLEYEKALRAGAPDGVRLRRDLLLPVIPGSAEAYADARKRYETALAALEATPPRIEDPAREGGGPRFYLAYGGENDRMAQERLARLYADGCPDLTWTAPHCRADYAPGPVRKIGFVSRHFFDHSIGRLLRRLLARLAQRDDCEIRLFDAAAVPTDPLRRELESYADGVERLGKGMARQRQQIADYAPDVLFYPDIGMDVPTYFLAFARLAPVQCVTWGHPVTTGIPALDYFLSCDAAEPADADGHYSEKLVRLGGLPFSYAQPERPSPLKRRADFGLDEAGTLYFLAQNVFKVHPDMDRVFNRILERDPEGQIVLLDGHYPEWSERLRARFSETLRPVRDRVVFLPRQSHDDFMRLLALADVSLDTFPFCGGNTTYQALAMGTPVVTLPGAFLRGRLSLAIYRHLGVMDCVAADADDYVRIAVRLGTDAAWRAGVEGRIAANLDRIFDDPVFLREAEAFLMTAEPPE